MSLEHISKPFKTFPMEKIDASYLPLADISGWHTGVNTRVGNVDLQVTQDIQQLLGLVNLVVHLSLWFGKPQVSCVGFFTVSISLMVILEQKLSL